jgi:hypothetical protein
MPGLLSGVVESECQRVAKRWKEYIEEGTNVKPLAPATLAEKIRHGSPTPDTPLMDTGEMVESIEVWVEDVPGGCTGHVGSRHPEKSKLFIYHEYGLGVPARPTLRPVVDEMEKSIADNIFNVVIDEIIEEFTNG